MKPTPSQTIGPFFAVGMKDESPGGPLRIGGRVFDGEGEPVGDAMIELWDGRHFARALTGDDGRWSVETGHPPHGYVAVSIFARGLLQRLVTRIYPEPGAATCTHHIHLQGETEFFDV
jgi:protocatechuate 3,4-dioxygenase, alpha subunit